MPNIWRPAGPKVVNFGAHIVEIHLTESKWWDISPAGCPIFDTQTPLTEDPRDRAVKDWIGWVTGLRCVGDDIEVLVDDKFSDWFFSYGWRRADERDESARDQAMILREVVPVPPWTYGDNRATMGTATGPVDGKGTDG